MHKQTMLFGLMSFLVACGEKETEESVPEETEDTDTEETTEEPSMRWKTPQKIRILNPQR